ncbi:MAG TPA: YIP1 family protein [Burkholderiales bacterium]|nr:YIP1 family protein [Burkholderiales bacterium]
MNFVNRLTGVFASPRQTFTALAEKPVWVDVLIVILIALAIYATVVAPYAQHEQLQMLKDSAKLKERMGEERFNQYIADQEKPATTWKKIQTAGGAPLFFVIAMLIQGAILMVLGRFVSTQGTFKQAFSSLIHANLIYALAGNGVRLILTLTRKSVMQVSTGLPLLFPKMEVTSTPYIIMSQVDFFQLWLFGVLAFGLAAAFKINLKKALVLSYTVWLLKALFNIGLSLVGMSFLR